MSLIPQDNSVEWAECEGAPTPLAFLTNDDVEASTMANSHPTPHEPAVEWRPVPDYPAYEVSNDGRIRRAVDGHATWRGRELTPSPMPRWGYLTVSLHKDGKQSLGKIHRLVALAFLGPPPSDRHHVAHFDGDKTNNILSNLRWASPAENEADKQRHGRRRFGEKHPGAKLSENDVRMIRALCAGGERQRDVAARYGVCQSTVGYIVRREHWGHVE